MDYRWLLRTAQAVVLFVAFIFDARAQKLYPISLCDFSIDTKEINFTVSEIFDARKDKNCIGMIHAGVNNRLQFAVFDKPGLNEIKELLENSGLYSQQNGLALRITSLKISESDLSWEKTAKAELNIDFFIRYHDLYYYISSVFASVEPKCSDVAGKQPENISDVIGAAFVTFSKQKKEVSADRTFTTEDLLDPSLSLRNLMAMPVLTEQKFKDGYYATFEEFLSNEPSIDINCEIEFSSSIKTICGDQVTEVPTLFGFAYQNKLYILYHHLFFELEKRNNIFFFDANPRTAKNSSDDLTKASAFASMFDSGRGGYSAMYVLDLKTGTIKGIKGL